MHTRCIRARDGVELSYRVCGAGPPVMLLHGFANWSEMWVVNGTVDRLADHYTVLLPDRRGHGRSGRPSGASRYGRHIVEDVFDILDAEAVAAAHLAGFSQGSEVALSAAALRPQRMRSLFLVASGWPGPALEYALEIYSGILDALPAAIGAEKTWLTPDPDMPAFRSIVGSIEEVIDIPRDALERVSVPAAGLVGERDPERPTLERLQGILPDFHLDVLPGVTHGQTWKHPSLPDRLRDFLDRVAVRSGPRGPD